MGEAIGGARGALGRMLSAHIDLLKAELSLAGRELGIIVGLGIAAFFVAVLTFILLYVGSFLFLGEWLFGSMGWGIIHGTLLGVVLIGAVALNLAGGQMGAYGWGFVWGLIVTILSSLLFASNLLREGAVAGAVEVEDAIPLHPDLLPTLVGLVVGAAITALVLVLAGWRSGWRFGSPAALIVGGILVGGILGSILGSAVFDNPGAVAISLTVGLVTWIVVGFALAARRGFDPEARYAALVPRESIAAFEGTREFLQQQWERQKGRLMGR